MKNSFKMIGLVALMACSVTQVRAQSGDRVGNGGDVIVCPGLPVELLDSYEMRQEDMTLDLPGNNMREKVLEVVRKIKKIDNFRGNRVETYALELVSDIEKREQGEKILSVIKFTSDVLNDVPDSFEVMLPEGCVKQQLVTQVDPAPERKRYSIAVKYWDRMGLNQQTLTVLHEAWYRTFLKEGALDSRFARYMNGLFASAEYSLPNLADYRDRLAYSAEIGSFGKNRVWYKVSLGGDLCIEEFYDDKHVIRGSFYPYDGSTYKSGSCILLLTPEGEILSGEVNYAFRTTFLTTFMKQNKLNVEAFRALYQTNAMITLGAKGEITSVAFYAIKSMSIDGVLIKKANFFHPFYNIRVTKNANGELEYDVLDN